MTALVASLPVIETIVVHRQRWSCTFESRTGARAQATFASVEEAQQFAERHAQASGSVGKWRKAGDTWVLITPTGKYVVTDS